MTRIRLAELKIYGIVLLGPIADLTSCPIVFISLIGSIIHRNCAWLVTLLLAVLIFYILVGASSFFASISTQERFKAEILENNKVLNVERIKRPTGTSRFGNHYSANLLRLLRKRNIRTTGILKDMLSYTPILVLVTRPSDGRPVILSGAKAYPRFFGPSVLVIRAPVGGLDRHAQFLFNHELFHVSDAGVSQSNHLAYLRYNFVLSIPLTIILVHSWTVLLLIFFFAAATINALCFLYTYQEVCADDFAADCIESDDHYQQILMDVRVMLSDQLAEMPRQVFSLKSLIKDIKARRREMTYLNLMIYAMNKSSRFMLPYLHQARIKALEKALRLGCGFKNPYVSGFGSQVSANTILGYVTATIAAAMLCPTPGFLQLGAFGCVLLLLCAFEVVIFKTVLFQNWDLGRTEALSIRRKPKLYR